ncbi:GNAT family N-acetyltransferase [Novosphingobium cyanobacteriorum]|uniref:GNAT family N-acetyltransferase n=1 Tax=Novosphingobium cyanobacteriorum TaxID=3024215 RepID=A0ABT6CHX9_9SPHN|nr:GNAT family N-acetyltransferase [Novosphingobium cyanobacteriorum]MDF8333530.1 GNAT family N-acetyltransferase [Novosphingobium cyanobacteriorum]
MTTLRLATAEDAAPLADLARRALSAKFEHLYRPEDFGLFLAENHSDEETARQIGDPGMRIAVIESADGTLLAFCKLVLESTLPAGHSDARRPLELKQLYTDPARIGGGLGARLMDWALAQAMDHGADEIQLSVYSENPEAQRFYDRHGFTKIADIEFWVGNHCDPEFLFARKMTPADGGLAATAQV